MQRLDSICIEILCPKLINHGYIEFPPCSRKYCEICKSFNCYPPYLKTQMPVKLECKKDDRYYRIGIGKWTWDQDMGQLRIRERDKCPSSFRNGNVSRNCHLQPGAECSFNCDLGCDKDPTVSILHRGLSGRWNEKTENLCTNCRRCPSSIR